MSVFPSLGCLPGPCTYRESTPDSRSRPTGRASPFWLCFLMRFSDCFPSFTKRQAHKRRGNLLGARASFSSDGGRLLPCRLGCLSLRPGWLRCPISLVCVSAIGRPQDAPDCGNKKSPRQAGPSFSEEQLDFGYQSSALSVPLSSSSLFPPGTLSSSSQ